MSAKKYVVLEHLTLPDRGLRFWTLNTSNNTMFNGEVVYKEVLFTNSEDEAIKESANFNVEALPFFAELEQYYKTALNFT